MDYTVKYTINTLILKLLEKIYDKILLRYFNIQIIRVSESHYQYFKLVSKTEQINFMQQEVNINVIIQNLDS